MRITHSFQVPRKQWGIILKVGLIKKSKNNLQNPFIIEIGCNDGIFLENFVGTSFKSLGIEPSLNVANIARNKGIEVENKFITEKTAKDVVLKYGNADYITAANVICHIPDILGLAKSIEILLNRRGFHF